MFRTLVVPLDGSQLAERAVPYAIRLAQASHARVVLTRAVLAPRSVSLEADRKRIQLDALGDARTYLADMADSMSRQLTTVEIATPYGRAADKILETVETYQADAVVMSTHGRTGFDHLLHGSVTEAVLARSGVPVFVVYARPVQSEAPTFSLANARLLVPQNGSEYDAPALRLAVDMLGPHGEIILLTIAPTPEHVLHDNSGRHVVAYLDQQEEALTREARNYLAGVAKPLRNAPAPITVKTDVRVGDPVSGIAAAALDTHADLIVMATHGRTGIQRAVLGSVAGSVLRTVDSPVVLVHPGASPPPDVGVEEPVLAELGPAPTF
jgi:nucleotide-binding universal stress UspA family protein